MQQPTIAPSTTTIESRVTSILVEGEVTLELAQVMVNIVGVSKPINGQRVLPPNEAKNLRDSFGVDNYYAIAGRDVLADYEHGQLVRMYPKPNP